MSLALAASLAFPADAPPSDTAPAVPTVITIVRVPRPWYAPEWLVTRRMRATLDQYRAIDGLFFKAYTHTTDRRFGGVYFWRDAASAEAWFNPAWFARVRSQYGVDGDVRRFSILRGAAQWPTAAQPSSDAVVLLTLAPDRAAAEALAGGVVARAWYVVADANGGFALLTLWDSHAGADAWEAGHRGLAHERFAAPILLPTPSLARP